MPKLPINPRRRNLTLILALALLGSGLLAVPGNAQPDAEPSLIALEAEAIGLADFKARASGPTKAVIVELAGAAPGFAHDFGSGAVAPEQKVEMLGRHARSLFSAQDALVRSAQDAGIDLLLRTRWTTLPTGKLHRIEYRFHYLMNGFVAYVAEADIERLEALPGVASVQEPAQPRFALDNSVNHILGQDFDPADRRLAVYGATEELTPLAVAGDRCLDNTLHPEETDWTSVDGYEGEGMYVAVIDAGLDYENPMFGGDGACTALPQLGGGVAAADPVNDNRKVVYFYQLGGATTRDDHGHGTHTGSTAAGYLVDSATTNDDPAGAGAPPNGLAFHGVAPQAKMLGYPTCNAAGSCPGDVELGIEDAASPTSIDLTGTDSGVAKPVADVVNLSLSGGTDPAGTSSRAANNAFLAGMVISAAASNDGPGAGTIGAPSAGTLAMSIAAADDPGSIAGSDALLAGEVPGETCAGLATCGGLPGPAPETGAASEANAISAPAGLKSYFMAGGGPLPNGSVSAHYVLVDRDIAAVPTDVGNRVALLINGTGAFASIVNPVAANVPPPAAIILSSTTQSATAVMVVQGVPVFTMDPGDAGSLIALMSNPVHGGISDVPARVNQSVSLDAFSGSIAGFSGRGPNAHANARYRTVKPDVAAPGVGVFAATTQTGNPDSGIGMANPEGYTTASGTSMATPHNTGVIALARQRLRELGFDSTDLGDPNYREKRFEAATLARAMVTNTATNMRTGRGVPNGDPDPVASINDMGAGLVDVSAALAADAVMTTNVTLFDETPNEYDAFGTVAAGNIEVRIPTHSFGLQPASGLNGILVRSQEIFVRDITAGAGAGLYDLTSQNNRNADPSDGVAISFSDSGGSPITTVNVPVAGEVSFFLDVAVDGTQVTVDPTEIMFFVTATHQGTGKTMRMPIYYRAIAPISNVFDAPLQSAVTDVDDPAGVPCPTDDDGSVTFNWSFDDEVEPLSYRVQCATSIGSVFFDNADEPLAAGANSLWSGSEQWTTQVNPDTGSPSYFIPDAAEQNESLEMLVGVPIPAGSGASLSFYSKEEVEAGFDFGHVEVSSDGGSFSTLASLSGSAASDGNGFSGIRTFDISGLAGTTVKVRFRMSSDLAVSDLGWWVEDINIDVDDYQTLGEIAHPATSLTPGALLPDGSYTCRVAGLFDNGEGGTITGPYSNNPVPDGRGQLPQPRLLDLESAVHRRLRVRRHLGLEPAAQSPG